MTSEKFAEKLKAEIKEREECANCPLFGRPTVFFERLYSDAGNCDVLFTGINPGKKEAEEGRPFCGPAGKILREYIQKTGLDAYRIAFTNAILCSTNNEKDIPNVEACINNCRPLARKIATWLKPRIYVPTGRNCAAFLFGIEGSITQLSGKIFHGKIVPIIHPASLIYNRSEANAVIFQKSLENILLLLQKLDQHQQGIN